MKKGDVFDERDVLFLLSKGDQEAFKWIYDRYGKSVFRAAYRYLDSKDVAGDIVQEVFSALWHKRENFTEIRNLESYLVTMAHRFTYKELRKWADEGVKNQEYISGLTLITDDSDHLIRNKECDALLAEGVESLPQQQKVVFQLSRNEGLTHEAIAKRMNLSQGTVKNHIVRALQHLRENLSPHVTLLLWLSTHL